jgi:hypothetical protein
MFKLLNRPQTDVSGAVSANSQAASPCATGTDGASARQ